MNNRLEPHESDVFPIQTHGARWFPEMNVLFIFVLRTKTKKNINLLNVIGQCKKAKFSNRKRNCENLTAWSC